MKEKREIKRVKNVTKKPVGKRLADVLSVTRSFGDASYQPEGLIVKPYVQKYTDLSSYIVIATDGVYNKLSDEDVIQFCKENKNTNALRPQKHVLHQEYTNINSIQSSFLQTKVQK